MLKNDETTLAADDKIYLQHMLHEYELLVEKEPNPGAENIVTSIKGRLEDPQGKLTVNDIYALELALITLKPIDLLRSEVTFLRARYAAFIGAETYAEYERTAPPYLSPHDAQTEEQDRHLRTDMQTLLSQMHQYLNFTAVRERLRQSLLKTLMLFSIAICAIGTGCMVVCLLYQQFSRSHTDLAGTSVFCLVACAGVLGGFVSVQQRLQTTTHQGDPMVNLIELRNGKLSIWLAPLSGGIFAVLMYHLFISSMLQGALFPVMANDKSAVFSLLQLRNVIPATMPDFAKLFIWSFLAGFAERLVPDTLKRIVENTPKSETPSRNMASVAPVSARDTEQTTASASGQKVETPARAVVNSK